MFFVVSKIAGLILFHPLNFLLFLGLFGLLLSLTRFARAGRVVAGLAAVLLLVAAFSPLSALVLRPLEDRFPQPAADMPAPTGIVVLGGALDEDLGLARGQPTLTEAAARLTGGVALALRYPHARLVFTGGSANLDASTAAEEASGVRALWLSLGMPAQRMTFESKSRNTYENATMTRAIVLPKPGERWLLVTSAAHMPRSVGIFRHVGWDMVAYPVDYRTFGDGRDFKPTNVSLDSLRRLDVALHEWVGLVAYRLTGKTDALFPSP